MKIPDIDQHTIYQNYELELTDVPVVLELLHLIEKPGPELIN